ncbi:MAG: HAD hydrolase-like protein [Clostridia bacterium]|nr:HAD hydrolase-like protein [Clostridia bacterium]
MCRLFRNYNLKRTSLILQDRMREYGVVFSPESDAFDIFKVISQQISDTQVKLRAFRTADAILCEAEAEAADKCEPLKGFGEVFPQIVQSAKCVVGVATNNSAQSVQAFLKRVCHGCSVPVVGRVPDMPERMKPSPWSVLEISDKMRVAAKDVIFVGDTLNDYDCSRNAGCTFVGMAATAKKREHLSQFLPADMIVNDYFALRSKLISMLKSEL